MRRSSRVNVMPNSRHSYWIPGSYTPTASEKRSPFLRALENKVRSSVAGRYDSFNQAVSVSWGCSPPMGATPMKHLIPSVQDDQKTADLRRMTHEHRRMPLTLCYR